MDWATFWGVVLMLSVAIFVVVAVTVAIGGFRDVFALFRGIDAKHEEQERSARLQAETSGAEPRARP